MKKYLLFLGFVTLTSAVMAMEAEDVSEEGTSARSDVQETVSSPRLRNQEEDTAVRGESVPPQMVAQRLFEAFEEDGGNFEYKGGLGIFGILSEKAPTTKSVEQLIDRFSEEYNILRKQNLRLVTQNLRLTARLDAMETDPNSTSAFLRAIKEAQEKADQERAAKVAVEEQLRTAEDRAKTSDAWARLLKAKEEKLLSEVQEKEATIILNQEREKLLQSELTELKNVVGILNENKKRLQELEAENEDLKAIQQEASSTQESIRNVVASNDAEIRKLKAENEELTRKEQEKEEIVKKLKQATEANDFFTQIKTKIKDPNVSDEDLALFIWAVKTVKGLDLDDLSEGHDERLIELIIRASRPYEDRPAGKVTCEYEGRTRTIGNDFVGGGLVWKGVPFNMGDCKFKGSRFETRTVELAQIARQKFRDHK